MSHFSIHMNLQNMIHMNLRMTHLEFFNSFCTENYLSQLKLTQYSILDSVSFPQFSSSPAKLFLQIL